MCIPVVFPQRALRWKRGEESSRGNGNGNDNDNDNGNDDNGKDIFGKMDVP
ncbi:hypothetical protein [Aminiphilus sp.]|uniref:hypothetical protein n=1 Tax=Aminiphilus sp. TaxID=1872488 RepID=UPI001BCB5267|nr:hypothetical protein [Aminiphilus sp.]